MPRIENNTISTLDFSRRTIPYANPGLGADIAGRAMANKAKALDTAIAAEGQLGRQKTENILGRARELQNGIGNLAKGIQVGLTVYDRAMEERAETEAQELFSRYSREATDACYRPGGIFENPVRSAGADDGGDGKTDGPLTAFDEWAANWNNNDEYKQLSKRAREKFDRYRARLDKSMAGKAWEIHWSNKRKHDLAVRAAGLSAREDTLRQMAAADDDNTEWIGASADAAAYSAWLDAQKIPGLLESGCDYDQVRFADKENGPQVYQQLLDAASSKYRMAALGAKLDRFAQTTDNDEAQVIIDSISPTVTNDFLSDADKQRLAEMVTKATAERTRFCERVDGDLATSNANLRATAVLLERDEGGDHQGEIDDIMAQIKGNTERMTFPKNQLADQEAQQKFMNAREILTWAHKFQQAVNSGDAEQIAGVRREIDALPEGVVKETLAQTYRPKQMTNAQISQAMTNPSMSIAERMKYVDDALMTGTMSPESANKALDELKKQSDYEAMFSEPERREHTRQIFDELDKLGYGAIASMFEVDENGLPQRDKQGQFVVKAKAKPFTVTVGGNRKYSHMWGNTVWGATYTDVDVDTAVKLYTSGLNYFMRLKSGLPSSATQKTVGRMAGAGGYYTTTENLTLAEYFRNVCGPDIARLGSTALLNNTKQFLDATSVGIDIDNRKTELSIGNK